MYSLSTSMRMPRVVVSLIPLLYRCPRTRCGTYGSSRKLISSADNVTSTAAIDCSSCSSFDAPMIGAVTPGRLRIQASAICNLVFAATEVLPPHRVDASQDDGSVVACENQV